MHICIPQQATFANKKINVEGTVYMLFKTFNKCLSGRYSIR